MSAFAVALMVFAVLAPTPASADSGVLSGGWETSADGDQETSMVVAKIIGATPFWLEGSAGGGVGVALIDSGISPVEGLLTSGKVINGPDLSFESQDPALMHLDSFGHGTHLAGIIAGRSTAAPSSLSTKKAAKRHFLGVAPDAHIVNVKVADRNGATDVSQVIAAIDWVVQHRNDKDMNIRVISLSFGTDGTQSYLVDPLAFAVEQAWQNGIVVVVAAGNDGLGSPLRNPALDPFVIAVGASDGKGTIRTVDDRVAGFSSCGSSQRHVDVVAPGKSIVSLLAPGSDAELNHPAAIRNGDIVGSGTSQAAAFVSGAAALIIDQRPGITPDQVKALLMDTAKPLLSSSNLCQGAGLVNLAAAVSTPTPSATQVMDTSLGTGSLEAARGSYHLEQDGVVLEGEQDIFGNSWDGASWSSLSAAGASWSGGDWNGASWSGASWSGMSWSGASWSGASWSGMSWSGASWSGASWSGMSWSGMSWSSDVWLGLSWNGLAVF
ncbi:MAG: S8 family serine peptidase [Acidimicrobiia bacterium]|nr:S8 family serine peptidase [Acidimicrobiia bacterium]